MGDFLRIAVGPTLSVLFFLVGYRRTVGARKERGRAAEAEIQRLLTRRAIVDGYTPSRRDVIRLIETKARLHRVKAGDLPSEHQLLVAVYVDVLENEFVAPGHRTDVLVRIEGVLAERQEDVFDDLVEDLAYTTTAIDDRVRVERQRQWLVTVVGLFAAVGGSLLAIGLAQLRDSGTVVTAWITAGLSLLFVLLAALSLRLRDRLEDHDEVPRITDSPGEFEQRVATELATQRLSVITSQDAVDFVVERRDLRLGIEVKWWSQMPTTLQVRAACARTEDAVRGMNLDEVLMVIPAVPVSLGDRVRGPVRVVDFDEMRAYLSAHFGGKRRGARLLRPTA